MALVNLQKIVTMRDTAANITALTGALEEGAIAYATDTSSLGIYTNGAWAWIAGAITLDADAALILDLQGASGQEVGLDTQSANTVLAGPATGAANEPTFRALVLADLAGIDFSSMILDYIHEHAINEDLSGLCDGARTVFILANEYKPETTAIYLNGVRQLLVTDYTEDTGYDQITMTTAPESGDILTADYILAGAI